MDMIAQPCSDTLWGVVVFRDRRYHPPTSEGSGETPRTFFRDAVYLSVAYLRRTLQNGSMRPRGSGSEGARPLTDREEEIARRVRQALHLPSSMSEQEVAQRFRGSVAWRRARLGLTGENLRGWLANAIRPVWGRARDSTRPLARSVRRLWRSLWR